MLRNSLDYVRFIHARKPWLLPATFALPVLFIFTVALTFSVGRVVEDITGNLNLRLALSFAVPLVSPFIVSGFVLATIHRA